MESKWPEYSDEVALFETPAYITSQAPIEQTGLNKRLQEGKQCLRHFWGLHVQKIQELKQHHVHVWDEDKKEYAILDHCRSKDMKNQCKSHFPRANGRLHGKQG